MTTLSKKKLEKKYDIQSRMDIFDSTDTVIGLRQIGNSPYLNFYIYGTDCLHGLDFRHHKKARANEIIENHLSQIKKGSSDHIKCKYLHTGILCPTVKGGTYIGIAKTKEKYLALIHLSLATLDRVFTKVEAELIDLDKENSSLVCDVIFDDRFIRECKARWLNGRSSIVTVPYKVAFFQNFLATLKP